MLTAQKVKEMAESVRNDWFGNTILAPPVKLFHKPTKTIIQIDKVCCRVGSYKNTVRMKGSGDWRPVDEFELPNCA